MPEIILSAKNIFKSFSKKDLNIINGISLELEKGQSIAIMGASGEGKTTLLHILGGLEPPSAGEIYVNNNMLTKNNAAKVRNSMIGYVFQTYNLLEDLTLLENILMPAMIGRNNSLEIEEKALDLLREVNLSAKKETLSKVLSGGEKQRAAIARSFINDPEIIIADEPSGNLDHKNSKTIHNLLISFVKKRKKSLLVATHDEELASLCDKKLLLKEGHLYNI